MKFVLTSSIYMHHQLAFGNLHRIGGETYPVRLYPAAAGIIIGCFDSVIAVLL